MNLEYINRTASARNCCKSIDSSLTSSERQRVSLSNNIRDSELQKIVKNIDDGVLNKGKNTVKYNKLVLPTTNLQRKNADAGQVIDSQKTNNNAAKKQ